LLIARERERGTLEALFVTPVRPFEIVLAKLIPYVVVGMIDIVICIIAAYFIFEVPMRGSLFSVLSASFLYLVVSLLLGLT
ncbi:ABC transporter permease, partial [Acinetobacter baumannii]